MVFVVILQAGKTLKVGKFDHFQMPFLPQVRVYTCTHVGYVSLMSHFCYNACVDVHCPFMISHLELEPRLNPDGTPAGVKLNRYAQYVKEHYAEVKQRTPLGGHKAVMQKLREQYYSSKRIPALGSFPKE